MAMTMTAVRCAVSAVGAAAGDTHARTQEERRAGKKKRRKGSRLKKRRSTGGGATQSSSDKGKEEVCLSNGAAGCCADDNAAVVQADAEGDVASAAATDFDQFFDDVPDEPDEEVRCCLILVCHSYRYSSGRRRGRP